MSSLTLLGPANQPELAAESSGLEDDRRPVYAETSFEVVASRAAHAAVGPGRRPAELVGLKQADVDLDVDVLLVLGQGLPRANRVLCAGDW
jgi:integrase